MLPRHLTPIVNSSLVATRIRQSLLSILLLFGFGFLLFAMFPPTAQGLSSGLVISQVYGGGGNSGSTFRNDFVELFNRGNAPITMTNWSLQYATATGSTWTVIGPLNGTLQPGQYWLIQLGAGGGGTTNLPAPDFTDTSVNMAATAGKVALVNNATALSGTCPSGANIIDFVGYGSTANCFEAALTAAPSATNAVLRKANGCTETDNNASDFMTGVANPRNSTTTFAPCNPPMLPPTAAVSGSSAICLGGSATIQAALTGASPWKITWSDGVIQNGVTTNPATRNVNPAMTTTYTVTAISDANFANGSSSGSAIVTVNPNPDATITAPSVVCASATGNIASVPDAGAGAMYTWSIAGGTITTGQGTRNLTWTAGTASTAMLSVTVKNSNGCSSNSSASVTINPATAITTQPQAATVCAGQPATFSVNATGTNLTYQWRKGGTDIPSATSNTFMIPAVTTADAASYSVVVTGACGVITSSSVSLTVRTPPSVSNQPDNQVVAPGAIPSFSASATGSATITRQWQVSTDNGATWIDIANATTATLTLPAATLADSGKQYRVRLTNACDTIFSNAALLTVLPVSVEIPDPTACIGEGSSISVKAKIANTGAAAVSGVYRAQLESGLVTRNNSCVVTGGGSCSFTGDDRVRWGGTIEPNQTITIEFQVQVASAFVTGTELCFSSTFEFNSGEIATTRSCVKVSCPTNVPSIPFTPESIPSDAQPGSVLFFNFYDSDIARPSLENTQFSITNTDIARSVIVHLFFVNAADCRIADTFLCLTPNQTTSFLASEYDPGIRGFLLAVAVDAQQGCPINFNRLIGSERFKLQSGHSANLNAVAIAALPGGPQACDPTETTARLDFDGVCYNLVPRALTVNNIQSPLDGNDTLLILNRIGGNYANGTATRLGDLLGLVYDDKERSYSFTFDPSGCQYVSSINNGAPRTSPPLTSVIPRGQTGWMRLQHATDAAMFGAVVNFSPNGFNQGHSLHALTYTDATITIPIFPPACVP